MTNVYGFQSFIEVGEKGRMTKEIIKQCPLANDVKLFFLIIMFVNKVVG